MLIGAGGANLAQLEAITGKTIYVRAQTIVVGGSEMSLGSKEALAAMAVPVKQGTSSIWKLKSHTTNPEDGISRLHGYVVDIEGQVGTWARS